MIDSFHKSFRKILHRIMINHLEISILDYSWTHRKRKITSNALLTSVCCAVTCTHTPWNDCLTRWLSLRELFIYSVKFILFIHSKDSITLISDDHHGGQRVQRQLMMFETIMHAHRDAKEFQRTRGSRCNGVYTRVDIASEVQQRQGRFSDWLPNPVKWW